MKRIPSFSHALPMLALLVLSSCKKEFEEPIPSSSSPSGVSVATTEAVTTTVHPGRYLAANCFQCHGTNGFAGELKIAGESYSELTSELNEFRAKDPKGDIMSFHAQAYTADEIKLIADYFSKQK
jgi:sulfide dehydrogenase cytochrome subunit